MKPWAKEGEFILLLYTEFLRDGEFSHIILIYAVSGYFSRGHSEDTAETSLKTASKPQKWQQEWILKMY